MLRLFGRRAAEQARVPALKNLIELSFGVLVSFALVALRVPPLKGLGEQQANPQ